MSTGQGSAEIGIGIGTTLNCNHESPIITAPLTQNPYADNESRDSLLVTHSLSADGFDASEDGTGRGTPLVPVAHIDVLPTMRNGADTPAGHNARSGETKDDYIVPPVAFESRFARNGRGAPSEIVPPLKAQSGETGKGDAAPLTMQGMQVRRLTPRECERLQGVPDGYTLVERNGKPMADGPRYKMLGNGFAVPVVRWIGERLAKAVK